MVKVIKNPSPPMANVIPPNATKGYGAAGAPAFTEDRMTYDPNNLVPFESIIDAYCEYCGDPIDIDDDTWFEGSMYIHDECMRDYARGLRTVIEALHQKNEDLVMKDMS